MSTQLLVNGRIYTPTSPDATAMAVTDGIVVWTGQDRPARALHPDAEVIDLRGALVTPAFVDPHVHVTATGLALTGLDLGDAASAADLLARVADHVADAPGGIVWGSGWDSSTWADPTPPTPADLDRVAPGRIVYLSRIDEHSAICSPALLAAIDGIADVHGYSTTLPIRAEAHAVVREHAHRLMPAEQADSARRAMLDRAAALGIVSVHECGGHEISGIDDFRAVLALDHAVEVVGLWGECVDDADEARALLARTGARALSGDLFIDGALGSRTALLREPYADVDDSVPDARGVRYLTDEQLYRHIRACTEAGIQAGFHAIGDAAVAAAAAAFARVADELGTPAVARCGHRLEHLEMIDADQGGILSRCGVIASMQPGFDAQWGAAGALYEQRLGTDRAVAMNPFVTLASAGVSLAFGSDAPVCHLDPWATVAAATNHHTPGQSVSPRAAFAACTRGAWRAAGVRDGLAGTLAPGAPASYAIWDAESLVVRAPADEVQRWSTDPRAGVAPLPDLDLGSPRCLRTVRDGVVIHDSGDLA